jgi:pyruvyltransferase
MNIFEQTSAWKTAKQTLLDPLRRLAFGTVYRSHIPLYYCDTPNWGDALSPILCSKLSGKPVKKMLWKHQNRFLAIGSILENANARAQIWGSGFIWPDGKLDEAPGAVHAVRGPQTRAKLRAMGIDCPEVYGDPALLFPYFYDPVIEKKYEVGVIPHFSDKNTDWIKNLPQDRFVRIIDVEGGIEEFVREVKSCELILSSSLHGLICADAYGVPNMWVKLSNILYGGNFKFRDYYESVGRETPEPVIPEAHTPLAELTRGFRHYTPKIELRPLVKACPFISAEVRDDLLRRIKA